MHRAQARKVARSFRGCWNAEQLGQRVPHPLTIVVDEEKGFILDDRPTGRGPKLVLAKRRRNIRRREIILRVKNVVPHELVGAAVKGIRAGTRYHVDNTARFAAKLCGVVGQLHVEFSRGIWRWTQSDVVEVFVSDAYAVDEKQIVT